MAVLANMARMTTATTGTGTITLGTAVAGFLTFAGAGITDGQTVSYALEDGANREVGRGVYTASGTTLTRTVLNSTNGGAAINLSGAAEVFITALKEDIPVVGVDVQPYDADTAKTDVAQTFTKPQRVSFTTLTYGATVTPDLNANNAFVLTMTGNPTIANPTNIASAVGQEVLIVFRGAFQPSFGSYFKFPGGTAPTFSGSLNAIGGTVISATEILMHGVAGYA